MEIYIIAVILYEWNLHSVRFRGLKFPILFFADMYKNVASLSDRASFKNTRSISWCRKSENNQKGQVGRSRIEVK